jgi:hypothetical protein
MKLVNWKIFSMNVENNIKKKTWTLLLEKYILNFKFGTRKITKYAKVAIKSLTIIFLRELKG